MGLPRFYVPSFPQDDRVLLDEQERRHAVAVLRLAVGDQAVIFDGAGHEALVEIAVISKSAVEAAIRSRSQPDRELPGSLELLVALPKGDRQKTLVDGLTELGAKRLVPLGTQRGVAQPTENALARLQRGVIETCKQCTRTQLMEIAEPVTVSQLAAESVQLAEQRALGGGTGAEPRWKFVAHPYATHTEPLHLADALALAATDAWPTSGSRSLPTISVAIGPEGGFTDQEVEGLLQLGWQPVHLGKRILRVEIAAIAAASIAAGWLERQQPGAAG
jgi:16S rRNA (uracil1498-N3)-methyltransferase